MAVKSKTLKFNSTNITFVLIQGQWLVPARIIGQALGYASEGQKLADHLSAWSKKWSSEDFKILSGKELKAFREGTPDSGVPLTTSFLMMLSPSGVTKVLQRSRAGLAQGFRDYLAASGHFLFKEHVNVLKAPPEQLGLDLKQSESQSNMADIFKILEVGAEKGLMTQKEQKLILNKVLDIKMTALSRENKISHVLNPDGTVNPSSLPAMTQSALATQEGQYRLLQPGEYHPAFMEWKTAEDIGKPYNLKADLVKKYIKAYALSANSDLPNNYGREYVRKNGGSFPIPDSHGFLVYSKTKDTIGGIAIYARMGDNQLVWRNFWSPEAVARIEKLLEMDRGLEKPSKAIEKAAEAVIDAPPVAEESKSLLPPN